MKRFEGKLFLNGGLQTSVQGKTLAVENPATGEAFVAVANCTREDVQEAVELAQQAFENRFWSGMDPLERTRILGRAAQLIRERATELSEVMVQEHGMTVSYAEWLEIPMAANALDFFATLIPSTGGQTVPFSIAGPQGDYLAMTLKEPLGVAGLITPWNFPLLMPVWKLGPALAAGCPVVLKPAPETPLTALLLAEILTEAGVPEGMIAVLPGDDEAGKALVGHPGVPKIAFTGETQTGIHILQAAAPHLKKVTLELGGKSPNIVFADAQLDHAVSGALFGIFLNSGQVCQAGSRILVQQELFDAFLEQLTSRASQLSVGPSSEVGHDLGPVITAEQLARIDRYVQEAVAAGATLHTGGHRLPGPGHFYAPTVLSNVTPDMNIAQQEVFGPVCVVMAFADEAEAIGIANGTCYGLAGAVWTHDIKRALRMARSLQAGTVWINTYQLLSPTLPFGGYKHSGIGRELGQQALDAYLQTKSVIVDLNDEPMQYF